MIHQLRAFVRDETGNATSEYALILTAFALSILGLMTLVGSAATGQLTFSDYQLNNRNGVTN